jgi:quercetin dioxygenase-like cupin family protein
MNQGREILITEQITREERGSFKSSLDSIALRSLISNIKRDREWLNGGLKALILERNPSKKILLTVVRKGTQIKSFQADTSITFQVIDGSLNLHFGNGSYTIRKGEIMIINEKIKYKIDSLEDSSFLMILSSGN